MTGGETIFFSTSRVKENNLIFRMCSPLCTADARIDGQDEQGHIAQLTSFQQIEHRRDVARGRGAQPEAVQKFGAVSFRIIDRFGRGAARCG